MQLGAENKLWFHGHWGFQFYLERAGGRAVDWKTDVIGVGDLLVVPANNAEAHSSGATPGRAVSLCRTIAGR